MSNPMDTKSLETLNVGEGKLLKLMPPKGSNYLKAVEFAGGELSLVPFYESLMCVGFINEEPVSRNFTKASLSALADKIGRKGVELVFEWYQDKVYPEINLVLKNLPDDVEKNANNPEVRRLIAEKKEELLKNS